MTEKKGVLTVPAELPNVTPFNLLPGYYRTEKIEAIPICTKETGYAVGVSEIGSMRSTLSDKAAELGRSFETKKVSNTTVVIYRTA